MKINGKGDYVTQQKSDNKNGKIVKKNETREDRKKRQVNRNFGLEYTTKKSVK